VAASNVAEAPPRAFDELGRRIVRLALPALGALLVEPIYNLTDSAIVGHLGKVPLGGLAIATGALNLVGWTSAFIEMATVSLVAFRRGAGDEAGAGRAAGAAYAWSAALGLVTAVAVYFAAPALVVLLGGHGAVAHQATTYLRIASLGLLPLLVAYAGTGHLMGLGDTRRPFLVALVANGVNVVLEVVLVYVVHAGIAGSAWGTVAAQFVSAALFVVVSARATVHARRPGRSEIVRLGRDGVPLTIRTVALSAVLLAATAVAARLGTEQLGGHQIALQIWLLLSLTLDAIAVPAQVFVGEALGRGEAAEARRVGRRTLQFGFWGGVGAGVLTAGLSWAIPWLFSSNPAVRGQALVALLLCGLMQPLAGLAFVLDGLVLGAGAYRTMQYAMIGALLAFVPLAAVTLGHHGIGLAGVWVALVCWLGARVLILGRFWVRGAWAPAGPDSPGHGGAV
jgi:putative MATE family efflux protein